LNITARKLRGISNWPSGSIDHRCTKGCSVSPGNVPQWQTLSRCLGLIRAPNQHFPSPKILLLLNRVTAEESAVSTAPARERPQSPSVVAVSRGELSLDEILQKIQRDIADGRPAAG
jgi:hypothetical protein